MSQFIKLSLLLLVFIGGTAHTTISYEQFVVFEDNFDDNHNNWVLTTHYSSGTIKNGHMELSSSGDHSDIRMQNLETVNDENDFEIEASIKIKGASTFCNALVWGTSSIGGYFEEGYSFGFNSEQRFIALDVKNWIAEDIIDWEYSDVLATDDFNKIVIRKKGDLHLFYINDIQVKALPAKSFDGQNFGFHVANGATIQVDYFKVSIFIPRS